MRLLNSPYLLWLLLALPSIPMAAALISGEPGPRGQPVTEALLHPTGEFSARFMIIALMISPLRLLLPRSRVLGWLMERRRYFGVAAFAYALAHTVLYIIDLNSLRAILDEFWAIGIWTGWLAFFIFIPLALTSNDWAVRRMGTRWKILQRCVYGAALGTLLHWIFVHNNLGPALVHFAPLAALEAYRLWRHAVARNSRRVPV